MDGKLEELPRFLVLSSRTELYLNHPIFAFSLLLFTFIQIAVSILLK
jgi:hypothetical protein